MGNYIYRNIKRVQSTTDGNGVGVNKLKSLEYTSHVICVTEYNTSTEYRHEQDIIIKKKIMGKLCDSMATDINTTIELMCEEHQANAGGSIDRHEKLCSFDAKLETCDLVTLAMTDSHIVIRHNRYEFNFDKKSTSKLCLGVLRLIKNSTYLNSAV